MNESPGQSPAPLADNGGASPQARQLLPLLRRRSIWLLMILLAYLSSYLWLGPLATIVPLVFAYAPAGLLYVAGLDLETVDMLHYVALHGIFWPMYLVGVCGARRLDIRVLRVIFIIIALMIIATLRGCSTIPGKLPPGFKINC